MASDSVPEELFGPRVEPGTDETDASGYRDTGTVVSTSKRPPVHHSEESWGESIASGLHDFATGAGEGWHDFENDLTGLLLRGTDAVGLTEGSHDRFNRARKEVLDPHQDAEYAHPDGWSRTIGYGAGNLVASAPLAEIKPLQALGATGRAARIAEMSAQGAAFGTVASGGDDIAEHAAIGAVAAPALGIAGEKAIQLASKAANPVLERLAPKFMQDRFARSQAGNPYVKADAQVSTDLEKMVNAFLVDSATRKLSKAQERTLLSRVNDLERTYLQGDAIKALDLLPSVKARLQAAMAKRHLFSDAEVEALRDGTPAAEAVADGITLARRLRAQVPEGSESGSRTLRQFASEALGGAAGAKLAGPLGGMAGSAAGRALSSAGARTPAQTILDIAAKAPKFSKLPEVIAGKEAGSAGDDLARLATEALDAPYLAKQDTERLAEEGQKVVAQNAKDDIRPGGGFRGYVYDKTGLLPSQQDAGALAALKDGKITPQQFDMFLNKPEKLMEGRAGLALTDRLASMADEGRLSRDPQWTPRQPDGPMSVAAPSLDAQGQPIRSTEAYRAGAAKNIARETDLLRQLDEVDPIVTTLADGSSSRASELPRDLYHMSDDELSRAAAIRAELESMKRGKGKGSSGQ